MVTDEAALTPDAVPFAPFLTDALRDGERGDAPRLGAYHATPGTNPGFDSLV